MTDYPYRMQLVVDPDNPRNVVAAGSVSIYDSSDTGKTTLLALTDPSGVPIPNPITSNANGFTPPFVTTSPEVLWVSGPYTDYFQSYKGMRDEAVAAKTAAENAAATAGAEAAAVAEAAIGTATEEATAAAASAAAAASSSSASATAAANAAALVGAPADSAVAALINASGSAARGALNATILDKGSDVFGRQVDARDSFTGKANGLLASGATADTGHRYTIAKNTTSTGYKILNGYLTHDQGTTTATTADYAGIVLPSRVGRIWADFRYPTSAITASENLVLIVSNDLFAHVNGSDSFADAATHFNITRTGWSYEILQKTPFTVTQVASGTFATPLAFDTDYQVAIEYSGTTATIYLPDGTVKTATHANINTWRGNHATVEHYAFDGSARSLLYVKNWGADIEKSDLSRAITPERVRASTFPKAMQYTPATEAVIAATTSLADVDATNVALTFTAPASGKALIEVEAFLEITTSGHMLWGLSHNGTGGFGGGLQRVHIGTCAERKRVRWLLNTLTPYQVVTVKLQHLAASGAVGSIKAGSSNGYFLNMTATPAQ